MSVLGSQLEIDMDPEGEAAILPRHQGNTGTGCYKLYDHDIEETRKTKMVAGMAMYISPGKQIFTFFNNYQLRLYMNAIVP